MCYTGDLGGHKSSRILLQNLWMALQSTTLLSVMVSYLISSRREDIFSYFCLVRDNESPAVCQVQFVLILIDANLMRVSISYLIQSRSGRLLLTPSSAQELQG
jgi:hypothetical protein